MKPALARLSTGIFLTLGLGALGTGCQHKADSVPVSSSVTEISTPTPSYSPSANYAPAQPVYDSAPAQPVASGSYASNASVATVGAGSYVVKKGDTLYGIARQRYGDGKQWQKIAAANPSISPSTLKVGQTINLP